MRREWFCEWSMFDLKSSKKNPKLNQAEALQGCLAWSPLIGEAPLQRLFHVCGALFFLPRLFSLFIFVLVSLCSRLCSAKK